MHKKILLFTVILLSVVFNLQSQEFSKQKPLQSEIVVNTITPKLKKLTVLNTLETITAKKKDILNTKVNAKLEGKIDLFFIADTTKRC